MAEIIPLVHPNRRPSRQTTEPLWRHVLGKRLRALRERQGRTLTEVAERAGISPQYLSEIERGRKEPSSEMIAAVSGALGTTLVDLSGQITDELRRQRVLDLTRERDLEFQHLRTSGEAPTRSSAAERDIHQPEIHHTDVQAMLLAA
jgi:transcriptional regulator with XRE-family HTH domain